MGINTPGKTTPPPKLGRRQARGEHRPIKPSVPHPARAEARAGQEPQRIAKLLARAGVASRREIERMIEDRRVAIDGVAIETPATLLKSLNGVTVDGKPVAAPEPTRLFLYYKPQGLLTHIARCIIGNRPIQIYVPLDTVRDDIAADDAAAIMVAGVRALAARPRVLTKIQEKKLTISCGCQPS